MIVLGFMMVLFNMIMIAEIVGLYRLNERRGMKRMIIFAVSFNAVVLSLIKLGYII